MASRIKLKESFEVESKHGAFFTGHQVQWTADGEGILCQDGAAVRLFGLAEGQVIGSFSSSEGGFSSENSEDNVTALVASPDTASDFVITSHKSGLLRIWNRGDQKQLRMWKSVHKGPVARMAVSPGCDWLATGGTDSSVRLWELATFNCIHSLRGCQGVISVLQFRPGCKEIFAAGDDCSIRGWVVGNNEPKYTLSAHYSRVTAIVFHNPSHQLISCGRDSVVCVWDLKSQTVKRTVPVYESLETMVLLPSKFNLPGDLHITSKQGIHVATGGERGIVRVWQIEKGREVYTQSNSQVAAAPPEQGGLAIIKLMIHISEEETTLAVVSADHNIIQHKLDTFECKRTLAGFCDEILDLALLGPSESHIAVASNSTDMKLYRSNDMHCQLIRGHTDLVLSLATTHANPCLLASAAKDNTVRVWLLDAETSNVRCVAVGERHTASVGALSFSQLSTTWLLTAAQDECLKAWKLPANITSSSEVATLRTEFSEVAHQKDINCVCVSPNDTLVATASQDKTAKLWSVEGLKLVGVLRGHRRGVWCARFSLTDQILATGSADCTCKLWSIADLSCVKTLEGHEASVLRLEFLAAGTQLLTAGGDGLLKLWTIKSSECVNTLDAHEGKIWALAVGNGEKKVVTGGADSTLIIWQDTTEEKQEQERAANEERVLGEQKLSNLMHAKDYEAALELALSLNRPHNALKSIEGLVRSRKKKRLGEAVNRLSPELQAVLLQFALSWNTNTRTCEPAQLVLEHLLTEGTVPLSSEDLAQALAYTDKHFRRLSQLRAEMHFLTYTAARMSLLPLTE